jgi:hypothetical protein
MAIYLKEIQKININDVLDTKVFFYKYYFIFINS